jgi:hypothetical protein
MFGKLKDLRVGDGAIEKTIATVEPVIREQLVNLQTLGAEVIQNDVQYAKFVIEPSYLAVAAATHGATKLIPQFKDRFDRVMVALRDELVVVEGTAVRLVEDFQARLPKVLAENFKVSG